MSKRIIVCKKIKTKGYQIWFNESFGELIHNLLDILDSLNFFNNDPRVEAIKISKKAVSLKINSVFMKITNYPLFEGIFRHLLLRQRCRNSWSISLTAIEMGIPVPTPMFYLERLYYGLPWQNIFASEYIPDSVDVEIFAKKFVKSNQLDRLENMLHEIVRITSLLWSHKLLHRDLSGKNILTIDGVNLFLVDLDSVKRCKKISLKDKIKNLTQLYDSFCDFVEEELLRSCIFSLLPEFNNDDKERIYYKVRELQLHRRHNHIRNLSRKLNEL
ncbi:MAG: lipopolysaccharide kinase InaA family protein [Candidatus Hydrogenedentes bacterium]|nr:lipopolysaccharide kinase InaA family protein [Candidatus Hydrogenedentota bacterium]